MLHNLQRGFGDGQQQHQEMLLSSAQMGFFSYPHPSSSNLNFPPLPKSHPHDISNPFSLYASSSTSSPNNPADVSLLKSPSNIWSWEQENYDEGDDHQSHRNHHPLKISSVMMKKMKSSRRKVREPRFCFKTPSEVDVLDDGYKWRKYGQKIVKNTQHPRSYYRCTQDNCRVKKRVERLAEDPRMVITTYEGRHAHSPSHDLEDTDALPGLGNFFW